MPKPPGSELANPPAGTALARRTGMPPARLLHKGEEANVIDPVTNVKG